jgi:uncharacterized protein with PIN domain
MKQIRCNKCQGKFESSSEITKKFEGDAARRITNEFSECPHCGHSDNHWIYASDYMPAGLNKRQQREWLENN